MQRYVCASKHFLQYMISIKHEICSSRIEWFSILQIKEMHNLRPPKIPLRHTKDVSDVWHVYPQAVSMRNQYVPSFVYKILRALQQNLIKWKYDDIMRMVLYAIFILIANLHSHFFGVYVKMYNTSNTKLAR